jgi:carbon monoxide dehydrogenase subunit G
MARYHATIDTPQATNEVFAYLSDFATAEDWDPGVVEAECLGNEPVGEGTRFRLVAEFMGRKTDLIYQIVEYDPPRVVTFLGGNRAVSSRDRITFEPTHEGTRVTYEAHLQLKGALRVLDPLLQVAFKRTGDRALAGLRGILSERRPDSLDAAA